MQQPRWVKPDPAESSRFRAESMFASGTGVMFCARRKDHRVESMGEGISLYFVYLRQLTVVFFVIAVLSTPAIIINASGRRMQDEDADSFGFARTTLGNMGRNEELPALRCDSIAWAGDGNVTYDTAAAVGGCFEPDINNTQLTVLGTTMHMRTATKLISDLDGLCTLLFILYCIYYRLLISKVVRAADMDQVTPSDYAVRVKGLPRHATEEQICDHFSELYDLTKRSWHHRGYCNGKCLAVEARARPKVKLPDAPEADENDQAARFDTTVYLDHQPMPVDNFLNTGNKYYRGKWVAEVAVIRPTRKAFQYSTSLQRAISRAVTAKARLDKLTVPADGSLPADDDHEAWKIIDRTYTTYMRLEAKLENLRKHVVKHTTNIVSESENTCLGAYVVFNEEESYLRCMDDYSPSASSLCSWRWWTQHKQLRFKSGERDAKGIFKAWRLEVTQAGEPGNLLFENIDYSDTERRWRRRFSACVLIVLLAISFVLVFVAHTQKNVAAQKIPRLGLCGVSLPATVFNSYAFPTDATLVRDRAMDDECGDGWFYMKWDSQVEPGRFNTSVSWPASVTGAASVDASAGVASGATVASTGNGGDPGVKQEEFLPSLGIACYCRAKLNEAIERDGLIDGISNLLDAESDMCVTFAEVFALAQGLVIGAALSVTIINTGLKIVLTKLSMFERHETITDQSSAIASRVFRAQFLNTAFVVLLVNAKLPGGFKPPIEGIGLFEGQFDDFSGGWYSQVGFSIMFTVLVGMFAPHAGMVVAHFVIQPLKRKLALRDASSQEELDSAYTPPEFQIYERYPITLNALFVGMSYSMGMPLLNWFVCMAFLVTLLVDRFGLFRHFKRPPRYDQALAVMSSELIPYALLFKLVLGAWMFGSPEIEAPDMKSITLLRQIRQWDTIGLADKLQRETVMPHYIIAGGLVVWLIMGTQLRRWWLQFLFTVTAGEFGGNDEPDVRENNPAFCAEFTELMGPTHVDDGASQFSGDDLLGEDSSDDEQEEEEDASELSEPVTVMMLKTGSQVRGRVWKARGNIDGVTHLKDQRQLTWETIRETTLHTYDYRRISNRTCQAANVIMTGTDIERLRVMLERLDLRESLFPANRWNKNPLFGIRPPPRPPKKTEPTPCRNVLAYAGDTLAIVEWLFQEHDGHNEILHYSIVGYVDGAERVRVEIPIDEVEPNAKGDGTKHVLRELVNGDTHLFGISVTNWVGESEVMFCEEVTPVGTPKSCTRIVPTPGNKSVLLEWEPPEDTGGMAIERFRIVCDKAGVDDVVVPGDQHSFLVGGLVNNKKHLYSFWIQAINVVGNEGPLSSPTEPVSCSTVPGPPVNVTAVRGDQHLLVSWQPPHDTEGADVTEYRLEVFRENADSVDGVTEVAEGKGSDGTDEGDTGDTADSAEYADATWIVPITGADGLVIDFDPLRPCVARVSGLANGTPVKVRVAAYNWRGWGAASPLCAPANPAGVPFAPGGIVVMPGDAHAVVEWAHLSHGNGEPVQTYTVHCVDIDDERETVHPAIASPYDVLDLVNGHNHLVRVTATNAIGTGPPGISGSMAMPLGPAAPPTNVRAVAKHAEAMVSWDAPTNNGGCELVEFLIAPCRYPLTKVHVPATQTSMLVEGLENNRTYTFTVFAVNKTGRPSLPSEPSNDVVPRIVRFGPSGVSHLLKVKRRLASEGKGRPAWWDHNTRWDGESKWTELDDIRGTEDDSIVQHLTAVSGATQAVRAEKRMKSLFEPVDSSDAGVKLDINNYLPDAAAVPMFGVPDHAAAPEAIESAARDARGGPDRGDRGVGGGSGIGGGGGGGGGRAEPDSPRETVLLVSDT